MSPIKEPETTSMSSNWSQEELEASVDAYLSIYGKHLAGEAFVKKDFYRDLSSRFGRSEKSFEWRFQNISHVLTTLGKKPLPGLLPAENVGQWVIHSLSTMLSAHGLSHLPDAANSGVLEQKEPAEPADLHQPIARSSLDLNQRQDHSLLMEFDVSQLARALPTEVSLIPVKKLELHVSVRTYNVLKGEIEFLQDLAEYSDGSLLRLRNFGETSLIDLKGFLAKAIGPDTVIDDFASTDTIEIAKSADDFSQLSSALKIQVPQLTRALPPQVAQLSVATLEHYVSVRTYNVLEGEIEFLQDLAGYSDASLLRLRNFGETSLVDLKRCLLRAVALGGLPCNFFEYVGIDAPAWLLELELPYLNLSVRVKNVMKSLGIERLEDLRGCLPHELLVLDNFGETSLAGLCEAIQARLLKGPPEEESYPDTLLEAVCSAVSVLSGRNSSILRKRFGIPEEPGEPLVDPVTLEECGEFHQVTRERVRQIQKKQSDFFQNQRWVLALKERLSRLLDDRSDFLYLVDLPSEDPWFSGCDGSSDAFKSLLMTFCPKFHCYEDGDKSGKYVVSEFNSREFRRAVNVVSKVMSTLSPIMQRDFESHLSANALSIDQFDSNASENSSLDEASVAINAIGESLPVAAKKYVGGFVRIATGKPQTITARIVPTVGSFGDKGATLAQIKKAGGFECSDRSLRNFLYGNPEISRIGLSKFALKKHNIETYETISEEIVQRIERDGGATAVDRLGEELESQFGIPSSSFDAYAKSPRFTIAQGMIRMATPEEIVSKWADPDISGCKNNWRISTGIYRKLQIVTNDVLRGSGTPILPKEAAVLGVHWGDQVMFTHKGGESLRVSWPKGSTNAGLGSLKWVCEMFGSKVNDLLVLDFDVVGKTLEVGVTPNSRQKVLGYSLPPIGSFEECEGNLLTVLADLMDLPRSLGDVCGALRKRGEQDLATELAELGDGDKWPSRIDLIETIKDSTAGMYEVVKVNQGESVFASLRDAKTKAEFAVLNPNLLVYSKAIYTGPQCGMLRRGFKPEIVQSSDGAKRLIHIGYHPNLAVFVLLAGSLDGDDGTGDQKIDWFNANHLEKAMLNSKGYYVSREQRRFFVVALGTRLGEAFQAYRAEEILRLVQG